MTALERGVRLADAPPVLRSERRPRSIDAEGLDPGAEAALASARHAAAEDGVTITGTCPEPVGVPVDGDGR